MVSVWAVLRPQPEILRLTGAAWLAFSIPHFVYHMFHLDMYGTADKVGNIVSLGGTVDSGRGPAAAFLVRAPILIQRGEVVDIAIAGGTGRVGRLVVEAARAAGHQPVVLARSTGVDLTTGTGLDEALRGVSAVIDVSNVTTTSRGKSVAFFVAATGHLLAVGEQAGVRHHVALSVVGSDRVDLGYYAGKRRQEELVLSGRVPASVLRATQFHEFAAQLLDRGGPVAVVPKMLSQPVAAREVASALVGLAAREPAGLVPELAGPEQHEMPGLVRQLARARGSHRVVVAVRLPGAAGKAIAAGALLPAGPGPRGTQSFRQWLTSADAGIRAPPGPESGRP